jgi:hypothetical protein
LRAAGRRLTCSPPAIGYHKENARLDWRVGARSIRRRRECRCWYYAMRRAESEMGKPASPTHEQKRAAVDALIDHVKVRDGTPLYVEIEWRV